MGNPLFVQTSEGWINLALVAQIILQEDTMDFIFIDGREEMAPAGIGVELPTGA